MWRDTLSGCSRGEVMVLLIQTELSTALRAFKRCSEAQKSLGLGLGQGLRTKSHLILMAMPKARSERVREHILYILCTGKDLTSYWWKLAWTDQQCHYHKKGASNSYQCIAALWLHYFCNQLQPSEPVFMNYYLYPWLMITLFLE